ncbi:hypothetical protein COW36_03505 [bacterium (Candidatus Blackallbacteria) CG17_big_fil_post_rev_8_21_14_2_50_48_46]|uniref:Helicase HerA central domain-containing protein n=1 Tax=bacterium (Candidatus Blackallbacteria) CG17_big_fil_post_rev_8_21_14_2_50_48_46 TaxID=2014261 RepID=A0A2M7G9I7_9BACT|nr:MAG: hypothetical protein COW64_25925 [bacterium (Candidatus Blackallbacteria) CG18_big_fil_WC_8_21_14_2_50_49_26]PIW18777.1 MAG: hypothetical protein COW36_03505 [bacterium (Candidatus Blackallbacteria) CG17_big_fil_post_rev_8_21_14_2_50_48_46]
MSLWGMKPAASNHLVHPLWRNTHQATQPPAFGKESTYGYEGIWGGRSGSLQPGHVYLGEGWKLSDGSAENPYLKNHYAADLDPNTRTMHMHVLGNTGAGKSHFLRHMIQQDILAGNGVCVIDPHGELVEEILAFCLHTDAKTQKKDGIFERLLVMSAPKFPDYVLGYNPMAHLMGDIHFHASVMADACLMAWNISDATQTPRLNRYLRLAFTILLHRAEKEDTVPQMINALHLLSLNPNNSFRHETLKFIDDEFMHEQLQMLAEMKKTSDILNQVESSYGRLYEFLTNPFIKATFQAKNSINIKQVMDESKILLCDLSSKNGRLPEGDAKLLAGFLQGHMYHTALSRRSKRPFYIYVDEFGSFLSEAIVNGLAQTRKGNVGYILSHQYLEQLKNRQGLMYSAVLGTTRTKVIFGGLSDNDREVLSQEMFNPYFDPKLIKYEQINESQWEKDDPERIKLGSGSSSETSTDGTSQMQGTSTQNNFMNNESNSTGESESTTRNRDISSFGGDLDKYMSYMNQNNGNINKSSNLSKSNSFSQGQSNGQQSQFSQSNSLAKGTSSGWSESLHFPKFVKEQVTSIQFYSLQEQLHMAKSMYAKLEQGEALVRYSTNPPFLLTVPPSNLPEMPKELLEKNVFRYFHVLFKTHKEMHKRAPHAVNHWFSHDDYDKFIVSNQQMDSNASVKSFVGEPNEWNFNDDEIIPFD